MDIGGLKDHLPLGVGGESPYPFPRSAGSATPVPCVRKVKSVVKEPQFVVT